ncbi:hypothetical protein DFH06DRAFT_1216262 [Mycena polygramma]|nr:hypothetical protein DFH06DRAFT_1216262 [Mycena polygramma]
MDIKPKLESVGGLQDSKDSTILTAYAERGAEIQRLKALLGAHTGNVKEEVIEISDQEDPFPITSLAVVKDPIQDSIKQEVIEISDDSDSVASRPKTGRRKAPVKHRSAQYKKESLELPSITESRPAKRRKVAACGDDHKLRAKKEDLPPDVVAAHMADVQPFEIKPPPSESTFPRVWLVKHFGFRLVDLMFSLRQVPTLPVQYVERDVLCGTPDINPHIPTRPGDPGLMCSVRQGMVNGRLWSVFIPKTVAGKKRWLYLGQYAFELVGSMTPAQFSNHTDTFQSNWAEKLLRTVKFDEYVQMRARIGLRKWGRAITGENVAREMERVKTKKGLVLTKAQVIEALKRGDEKISVVRMKCVAYDHQFMQHITTVYQEHPGH